MYTQVAIYESHGNHKPKTYNKYTHKKREKNPNITLPLNHKGREQKKKKGTTTTKNPTKNMSAKGYKIPTHLTTELPYQRT